tara:strand:- start:66 stop:281 length:216 start_codon:yes stop_codon:yes gene_type:complete
MRTIDLNFEQQLPDVQILDVEEVGAGKYVVWTKLDKWSPFYKHHIGRGSYGVYISSGYIEDYRTNNKITIN